MTEAQALTLIRRVIRKELVPALMGTLTANADQFRSSGQRFAAEGPIPNMRNILPFGLASRAPAGTPMVVSPIGHDPSHLNILGSFDPNRPAINDGEVILYDQFGHQIYLSESKIQVGSMASSENMVLGQVFKTMMDTLLEAIANHTHTGNLGYLTTVPTNQTDFENIKASPIDDNMILSDVAFTEKGS